MEQSKIPVTKQIKYSPKNHWISPTVLFEAPHDTWMITNPAMLSTTKYLPASQDSAPLDHALQDHTRPGQHSDSSDKYSEELYTHPTLAELLEQFQQLQDQFIYLKSATCPPTHMAELIQLTYKLQHLIMMLQLPSRMRNICTQLCKNTQTLCVPERGKPHKILTPGCPNI